MSHLSPMPLLLAALLGCSGQGDEGEADVLSLFGGTCSSGDRRCDFYGDTGIYRCEGGQWSYVSCEAVCGESGLVTGAGGCQLLRDMEITGCDCRDPAGDCTDGDTRCDRMDLQVCQDGGWIPIPCPEICALAGSPGALTCAHSPSKGRDQCYCGDYETDGGSLPEGAQCSPPTPENPCGANSTCCRWSIHDGRCLCDYCSADSLTGC